MDCGRLATRTPSRRCRQCRLAGRDPPSVERGRHEHAPHWHKPRGCRRPGRARRLRTRTQAMAKIRSPCATRASASTSRGETTGPVAEPRMRAMPHASRGDRAICSARVVVAYRGQHVRRKRDRRASLARVTRLAPKGILAHDREQRPQQRDCGTGQQHFDPRRPGDATRARIVGDNGSDADAQRSSSWRAGNPP